MAEYFSYGQTEIDALKAADPILGDAIDRIGEIRREVIPDLFAALIHSIIGQQISTKAQITVWSRFCTRFAPLSPQMLSTLPLEELQSCGISLRKAEYIHDIAAQVTEGTLDLAAIAQLSDEEVIAALSKLRGIGRWTAEMLLIFSLQRKDVLSFDDLAIQRGLRMLYHHRKITPTLFRRYRKRYAPYASIASLYLWAIAGGVLPEMKDYQPKSKKQRK